jgi:hypothetical protein
MLCDKQPNAIPTSFRAQAPCGEPFPSACKISRDCYSGEAHPGPAHRPEMDGALVSVPMLQGGTTGKRPRNGEDRAGKCQPLALKLDLGKESANRPIWGLFLNKTPILPDGEGP